MEPLWRRRFFKFHYMSYSENKPRPRQPCFLLDFFFVKESKSGPPKEHSYQLTMKSIEPLWGRRIFKVSLYNAIVKISPAHGGHVFCWIKISIRNLKEVHPRNIPTKINYNEIHQVIIEKKNF